MKALVVIALWALSGSYVGGLLERITGLGLILPVFAGFTVAGLYLAVRIAMSGASSIASQTRGGGLRRRQTVSR